MSINFKEIPTDLSDVGEQTFPVGDFVVYAESAEMKNTKSGGQMAKVVFKIVEGQKFAGKKIFQSFNLVCPTSVRAEQIGKGQLSALCKATCGKSLAEIDSSEDFLFREFVARIKTEESDGYDPTSKITSFKPLEKEESSKERKFLATTESHEKIPF